ncbi:MAG: OadG family transporter subunit [Bacilli bacterium]
MFLLNNIDMGLGNGALLSLISILIVFIILVVIIFFVWLLSKIKFKEAPKAAAPIFSSDNKKLTIDDIEDEDMMVAALVATADYVEETKEKDARLVSIKKIG